MAKVSFEPKINGVTVKPAKMDISYQDVDYNSGRAADGTMYRNRVANKVKIAFGFNNVSPEYAYTVLVAASGVNFECEYYDIRTLDRVTKTFYCGDQSTSIHSFNIDGNGKMILSSVSFDVIEV